MTWHLNYYFIIMKTIASSIFSSLLACTAIAAADNSNLIVPPYFSKADMEEKILVIIPGANVATSYYKETAIAIQK